MQPTRKAILFTTGQAIGATGVPEGTLRRYVQNHIKHFSEGATISSRGRRFTDKDIELITMIRGLYARGFDLNAVEDALLNGFKAGEPTRRDVADAVRVTWQATEFLEKATQRMNEIQVRHGLMQDAIQDTKGLISDYNRTIDRHAKAIHRLETIQNTNAALGAGMGLGVLCLSVLALALGFPAWITIGLALVAALLAAFLTYAGMITN